MAEPFRPRALASAVVATLLLTASCATAPVPTRADVAAANRVYMALNADPIYYLRHVNVQVNDGVASLSGYVWSADAIYRARQIARGVPGIRGVVSNELELEREGRSNGTSAR